MFLPLVLLNFQLPALLKFIEYLRPSVGLGSVVVEFWPYVLEVADLILAQADVVQV